MRHALLLICLSILAPRAFAKGQADRVTEATLTVRTVLEGIMFPAGTKLTYVERFDYLEPDGFDHPYLARAKLGRDAAPCGVPLPRGAEVSFANGRYGEQNYASTPTEDRVMTFVAVTAHTLEGVELAKGAKVTVQCRGGFGIAKGGQPQKLRRASKIAATYTLGTWSLPSHSAVEWYPFTEGGNLASAVLGADLAIDANVAPEGTRLTFYSDGVLKGAAGAKGVMRLGGATCALALRRLNDEPPIEFHPNGKLAVCLFPASVVHASWDCQDRQGLPQLCDRSDEQTVDRLHVVGSVERYASGALRTSFLSREQVISGVSVLGWFVLHENGTLREASVRTQKIKGVEVQGAIELDDTGSLKQGTIAPAQQIDGRALPKDCHVTLSPTGKLPRRSVASGRDVRRCRRARDPRHAQRPARHRASRTRHLIERREQRQGVSTPGWSIAPRLEHVLGFVLRSKTVPPIRRRRIHVGERTSPQRRVIVRRRHNRTLEVAPVVRSPITA